MPKNSKVGKCYDKLVQQGKSPASAAAICQDSTGQSLQSGKKAKTHDGKPAGKSRGKKH